MKHEAIELLPTIELLKELENRLYINPNKQALNPYLSHLTSEEILNIILRKRLDMFIQ